MQLEVNYNPKYSILHHTIPNSYQRLYYLFKLKIISVYKNTAYNKVKKIQATDNPNNKFYGWLTVSGKKNGMSAFIGVRIPVRGDRILISYKG